VLVALNNFFCGFHDKYPEKFCYLLFVILSTLTETQSIIIKFFHLVVKLIIVNLIPVQRSNLPAMCSIHLSFAFRHASQTPTSDTGSVRFDEETNPSF